MARRIEYSYKHVPTIRKFSKSDAFVRGLMGPVGAGKSSGCAIELVKRGMAQPRGPDGLRKSRWAVIRGTYTQLKDTTIKTFCDWFPPKLFGDFHQGDHRYIIKAFKDTQIEILFRALDRPDQIDNLLSLDLTAAWVNEAREIPWSIIEALQTRVSRYPSARDGGCEWAGIILDTNPPDEDSDWFKYFEVNKPPNAEIFKQPGGLSHKAENLPFLNQTAKTIKLPEDDPRRIEQGRKYYRNLSIGKSEEWKRVYIDGKYGFVLDGKPVFPEYEDEVHCKEVEPVQGVTIRRGWDFGLSPACTFSQLLPSGQWIVFDEIVGSSGIDRFSDEVLSYCAQEYPDFDFVDYGDPAGTQRSQADEKTCFQILRSKNIDIQPGEQTLSMRLESIRFPMNRMVGGKPGFQLHPKCKRLRKGFMGAYHYRRLQVAAERYSDLPDKNLYSHPMDALQYDASRLFGQTLRGIEHTDTDFDWFEQVSNL